MNEVKKYGPLRLRWNPREAHHLYWGLICVFVALVASFFAPLWAFWIIWPVYIIGVLMILDDLYQHMRQVKEPDYHSPIHQIYVKYLRRGFIIKLEKLVDGLGE